MLFLCILYMLYSNSQVESVTCMFYFYSEKYFTPISNHEFFKKKKKKFTIENAALILQFNILIGLIDKTYQNIFNPIFSDAQLKLVHALTLANFNYCPAQAVKSSTQEKNQISQKCFEGSFFLAP